MGESSDTESELIGLAGEFYVRRVYDSMMKSAESARKDRTWFYRNVPKQFDGIIDDILPDIVSETVLTVIEQLKISETLQENSSIRSIAILADGEVVTPADFVDLYYESFGPDGLFAKYSKFQSRLPAISEDP